MSERPHPALCYLGRRYVAGVYDCADLARDYLFEAHAIRIDLPARALGVRSRDAQMARFIDLSAQPVERARDGDIVLMRAAGRRAHIGHHVGVCCMVGSGSFVLHLPSRAGACLHPLASLPHRGFDVIGFYRMPRGGGI